MRRDWQKDMRICEQSKANGFSDGLTFLSILPEIGIHWLQQYAATKEELAKINCDYYADKQRFVVQRRELADSEAREQKLREAIDDLVSIFNHEGSWRSVEVSDGFVYALWDSDSEKIKSVENMLDSLYPKEETQ
ncbi:hypothetical protein PANG_00055 [Paenibacillus phage PG1]|uniref:hypothetical protein n=1 Tax=Paenibacillus phage PG1 TaxID=754053 RepID=UPI0003426DD7|nr:hypothetical protein PANG_00055 [Paenibacillus phage PG1]AGN33774.1 hypothetical protein PANG_00055 [Paenibacillus phage PG1]